ncbi:sensor histidine kinase [Streptomyces sp. RS10V-4]|uniref:sensor histidine kinase n=1 Tax=Streptomyces rhizoryzae TaxID=2932493 RepID=UPI002005B7D8|nr:sensor histidine kinase [Streptomyces rhizoryzae]MCK7623453.1 sensor histidine kinase [Streptomyces rhizoryzae]
MARRNEEDAAPGGAARGRGCERGKGAERLEKGPGRYTFLPWMLMETGALSSTLQGRSGNVWLAGAGLLAFNALYVTVIFTAFSPRLRDTRRPLYALAALTAVTLAVALGFGGEWFLFFPLLSLASGTVRALRGKRLGIWLIALSGGAGVFSGWHGDGPWGSFGVGYGTFLSGMVTATVLSLFDTVHELRATRQELARSAVEKERLRFSRDLHDLLGHTLSVVVVKAEAVRRLAPRDLDAALGQAADIEAVGRQALTEIREAVSGYREGSLATELDRARSALDGAGIEPVVRRAGPPLPPQAEALLGWVVREGVTNTVRHSGATRCEIEVRADEDRVRLTLTDDGRGPVGSGAARAGDACARPGTATETAGGTGLAGLAERLAAAGGTLRHGPDGRRGFRVTAELPVGAGDLADVEEGAR